MVIFEPSAVRACATVTRPGTAGAARARSGTALTAAGAASRAHPAAVNSTNPSATAARPNRQHVTAPFSCARSRAGH
jgi:hypothetical protein